MTRARQPKPTAPPLAVTLRSALAQGWHTLDALEAMAPGAPSTRRARVHAALEELRLAGMVREERFARGVAEVRELPPVADGATCPACKAVVREHDDHHAWCAVGIRDCSWWAGRAGAAGPHEVVIVSPPAAVRAALTCPKCGEIHEEDHCLRFATLQPTPAPAAPAPPVGQSAPVEPPREPTDPHFVECRRCKADPGHPCKGDGAPHAERAVDAEAWARVQDGLPPAPKGPGPSSRCAVCDRPYARHADAAGVPYTGPEGHPFTPKPRGRPRVTPVAAPFRSHATPETRAMLDAVCDEADERLAASQAADPDVEELPTASEQKAILDGAKRDYEAAVAGRGAPAEPETSRGGSEDLRPGLTRSPSTPTTPERYRFWSPSHGLGWLTWGDVCPSTPTRFEPDDGAAIEWIWTQCGVGRPGQREPKREGPAAVEWRAWEYFKTTGGETLVFRRGGAPPGAEASRGDPADAMIAREIAILDANPRLTQPIAGDRCRPPLCHADDIHEPSRLRAFARPLCEAHRRWVEGAGGTIASAADMAAMREAETV